MRHLTLAVAAMLIVLSSSTYSDAEQRKPGTISPARKEMCDSVLNDCIFDCYDRYDPPTSCTRACTNQYRRCKRGGNL